MAARDYLSESSHQSGPSKNARARWEKIEKQSRSLMDSISAQLREAEPRKCTPVDELSIHFLKINKMFLEPLIGHSAAAASRASVKRATPRIIYQGKVLRTWVALGGQLRYSRHPKSGKVQGPLVRYFFTVVQAVMGDSSPSPESLPDIVKREEGITTEPIREDGAMLTLLGALKSLYEFSVERLEIDNEGRGRKIQDLDAELKNASEANHAARASETLVADKDAD